MIKIYLYLFVVITLGLSSTQSKAQKAHEACQQKWQIILDSTDLESVYQPLINLCNDDFKKKLKQIISTNKNLGYRRARQIMFGELDNFGGVVCSVYSKDCVKTKGIPNSRVMNCEHTWPQSRGASGIAKSDLHHLYPTNPSKNSLRSNWPFCDVKTVISGDEDSALGYSEFNTRCFEPPIDHKGNVARSLFYFSIRYDYRINKEEEDYLKKWHKLDVVDQREIDRNADIKKDQKNSNPFIDHPSFISVIADF
ncbi:MAG: endonuclease [Bacteriovoracaceae bacterium]|nr:endonuclease [Bacteriovoracaceae bacterium]